jgi:hypothetical protein
MDGPRCVGGRVADADGMGAPRAAGTALERNHKTMGSPKMTKLIKTEAKLRKAPPLCRNDQGSLQVTTTDDDMMKNLFGMKTRVSANGPLRTKQTLLEHTRMSGH